MSRLEQEGYVSGDTEDKPHPTRFVLPLNQSGRIPAEARWRWELHSLPKEMLVDNAIWFCRLRWVVIALLTLFGALSYVPGLYGAFGVQAELWWPFHPAVFLFVANVVYLYHARWARAAAEVWSTRINLWTQISLDLLVLTVVVHWVGSVGTPIPNLYLFHIVLACIFLSRSESFVATLMGCAAYAICVALEMRGILADRSIFVDSTFREQLGASPSLTGAYVVATIGVWMVVWYLASRLSSAVRQRDRQLAETNQRLEEAQVEKAKHAVRTTHELKAPFAAIRANADFMLQGYCGPLPGKAVAVLERITARCDRLGHDIQEMLHLASFHAGRAGGREVGELDISEILRSCVEQVSPIAQRRSVKLQVATEPAFAVADKEQMVLLFTNLVTNAVVYSYEGGRVRVESRPGSGDEGPVVVVADEGIGISPDKLPHVFDEYFRTEEGVRHNEGSSGLGLAIVKHVAEAHRLRVTVESQLKGGTTFTLRFPGPTRVQSGQ